jgi:L-2-hydroxyglutarate oxidase LhgO
MLSANEVVELEPHVRCSAALLSPSTGIVDAHEYMVTLQGDLESTNGVVAFDSELVGIHRVGDRLTATVRSGGSAQEFRCRHVINSAGLYAVDFLRRVEGFSETKLRSAFYAKGNYFACQGVRPFTHLVYPMPNEAGLGVHATLSLDGATRFGPDVEWIDELDYSVDPSRCESFYGAIREYWPTLPDRSLQPDYAGIRPKLVGPDGKAADFVIEGPAQHGFAGLVNLLGIESPGLTSSLAIAEYVATTIELETTAT